MPDPPAFDIDLDAEVRKMAQRQYLNDVHYLVQLVRHALRHAPAAIEIASTASCVCLAQDGESFSSSERDLLLTAARGEVLARLEALQELERRFGATMLSLIVGFPKVEIVSAGWRLAAKAGACSLVEAAMATRGYRITVWRRRASLRAERRELAFYSAQSAVPIRYNGRRIDRAAQPAGILPLRARERRGIMTVAIPEAGFLSTVWYLKHGIRFGVRRFLDPDGAVMEASWDSHRPEFEPTFAASIEDGDCLLPTYRDLLWRMAGERFSTLPVAHKQRVRELMRSAPESALWDRMQLFDSVGARFAWSMHGLRALEAAYGTIPCTLRRSRHTRPWLPCLGMDEIAMLRRRGHDVTVVVTGRVGVRLRGLASRLRCLAQRLAGSGL